MTAQAERLEEIQEKLRGRVDTIEQTIVELRTDMKSVRWILMIGIPVVIGQLFYLISRIP